MRVSTFRRRALSAIDLSARSPSLTRLDYLFSSNHSITKLIEDVLPIDRNCYVQTAVKSEGSSHRYTDEMMNCLIRMEMSRMRIQANGMVSGEILPF